MWNMASNCGIEGIDLGVPQMPTVEKMQSLITWNGTSLMKPPRRSMPFTIIGGLNDPDSIDFTILDDNEDSLSRTGNL